MRGCLHRGSAVMDGNAPFLQRHEIAHCGAGVIERRVTAQGYRLRVTRAVAIAANPSDRPVRPSPSVVVADT